MPLLNCVTHITTTGHAWDVHCCCCWRKNVCWCYLHTLGGFLQETGRRKQNKWQFLNAPNPLKQFWTCNVYQSESENTISDQMRHDISEFCQFTHGTTMALLRMCAMHCDRNVQTTWATSAGFVGTNDERWQVNRYLHRYRKLPDTKQLHGENILMIHFCLYFRDNSSPL